MWLMTKLISNKYNRQFVCFIHSNGLDNINLGLSLDWHSPNIEIHLPFCFIKIGWQASYKWGETASWTFGKEYNSKIRK